MLNLDPGKLLVIAVVAIILLGPDKLPQVARQVGGAWRSFNEFRHRMESEVRSTMPDLPPTSEIARLARSPSALLNHLSNMSAQDEESEGPVEEPPDGAFQPPATGEGRPAPAFTTVADGTLAGETTANGANPNGSDPHAADANGARAGGRGPGDAPASEPAPPVRAEHRAASGSSQPSDVVVPGDPSLN
jgi:sec-independent protein translocase protein TatB